MVLPTSFMLHVTWKMSWRSPSRPSRLLQETSLRVGKRAALAGHASLPAKVEGRGMAVPLASREPRTQKPTAALLGAKR